MSRFPRTLRLAAAALVVSGGLIVASCGGGTVQSVPLAQPTSTAAPSSTQTVPTTGGTLAIPTARGGQQATLSVAPGAPAGILITTSSSVTAPGSAPAPSSVKRTAAAVTGAVPFFYLTLSVSAPLAATLINAETVTLTANQPPTASYYVEFDDITSSPGSKLGCAGPGTVSAGVATISNNNTGGACASGGGGNITLTTGHTYLIQFYYVPAGTATPTPSSSASAAASSSPSPTASPTGGTPSASPSPQPSTTASAAVTGTQMNTGSVAMPAFGSFSGSLTSGPYQGSAADSYRLTYGNYNFGGTNAPTPPPNSGTVYAQVSLLIPTAPTSPVPQWTGAPPSMTLTVPTTAGLSSVTVRMWEVSDGAPNQAMCLNQTTGAANFVTTPGTGGVLTFPSPLQSSTVTGAALTACMGSSTANDANLNPLFGTNAGVWILVTGS